MKIALDAMGGDFAPEKPVLGALEAAENLPGIEKIYLVGRKEIILDVLQGRNNPKLEIINADEVIGMDEHPGMAFRRKKNASVSVAARMVREGKADALVSAGSTGAQMAASLLVMGRIKGIDRPAIAAPFHTPEGTKILIDAGANAECKLDNFVQFAVMGTIYSREIFGIENPSVGLVNIGSEETKGTELLQAAYRELSRTPGINFIGNIEGREIPAGAADVVVCDGFVGNVILKLYQGFTKTLMGMFREEVHVHPEIEEGAKIVAPAFDSIREKFDYSEVGGAVLLGVKGISIICHGTSDERAIYNALRVAEECVRNKVSEKIKENTTL